MTGGLVAVLIVLLLLVVTAIVVLARRGSRGDAQHLPGAPAAGPPSRPAAAATTAAATGIGGSGARTFTHLIQVQTSGGNWGNLRDPHSGRTEGLGTVTASEADLPKVAHRLLKQFEGISLRKRVVFFVGDRADQRLTADDVYGVVMDDSDVVVPGLS